jgi:hypothetical protein
MFGCLFVTLALTRRSELFGVRSDHCLKLLLVHLQKLFLAVSEQQAKLWDEEDTQRDNGQEENTRADQRKSNGAIRHQEDDNNEYYHETEVVHLNLVEVSLMFEHDTTIDLRPNQCTWLRYKVSISVY